MICKLCNREKKGIKAHIIPKSFYRSIDSSKNGLKIFSGKEGVFPKRSQIGLYDSNILCHECEKRFAPYDDYGAKILLNSEIPGEIIREANGEQIGCLLNGVDYHRLKLFIISVLWRADISSLGELSKVNLGPFSSTLKSLIESDNPGDLNDFSVLLTEQKFLNDMPIMIIPYRVRFFDGLNFYEISIGRYKAFIKVDRRNIPSDKIHFVLQPDEPLPIAYLDYRGSPTEKIIRDIVMKNRQLMERR
jgi:hypothetical protein